MLVVFASTHALCVELISYNSARAVSEYGGSTTSPSAYDCRQLSSGSCWLLPRLSPPPTTCALISISSIPSPPDADGAPSLAPRLHLLTCADRRRPPSPFVARAVLPVRRSRSDRPTGASTGRGPARPRRCAVAVAPSGTEGATQRPQGGARRQTIIPRISPPRHASTASLTAPATASATSFDPPCRWSTFRPSTSSSPLHSSSTGS